MLKRLRDNKKGQVLIELAMVLPFVAILLTFAVDVTQYVSAKWQLNELARMGTRTMNLQGVSNNGGAVSKDTMTAYRSMCNAYKTYVGNDKTPALYIDTFINDTNCNTYTRGNPNVIINSSDLRHKTQLNDNLMKANSHRATISVSLCGQMKSIVLHQFVKNSKDNQGGAIVNGNKVKICSTYVSGHSAQDNT